MGLEEEFAKNRIQIKTCTRVYNSTAVIYGVMCLIPILSVGISTLITFGRGGSLLDGMIFKALILGCGFYGAYRKNDVFTVAAPIIAVMGAILYPSVWNDGLAAGSVALAVMGVLANRKYRWLEQQYGFPYFNERFEEQNMNAVQRNIKDDYQVQYEELKKKSEQHGSDMDEL
ncbi:MAG: hypothetical protein IJ874_06360 [Ruminococcus sp.]|nr:hypothetical protein [Ruminococcus sp.]